MIKKYAKPFKSLDQLVELFKVRGLCIDIGDEDFKKYLTAINYYRFTGYALPFLDSREVYKEGVKVSDILYIYKFDRELRDLLLEALEVIELTFRTILAREFSNKYGALGYRAKTNFKEESVFNDLTEKLDSLFDNSKALCALELKNKYKNPPFWSIVEVSTFGILGRFYENMHRPDQKVIAEIYGFGNGAPMLSYMKHLISLRNICAHHGRLYDLTCTFNQSNNGDYPYTFSPLQEWEDLKEKGIIKLGVRRSLFEQFALVYRILGITDSKVFDRAEWKFRVALLFEDFVKHDTFGLADELGIPKNDYDTSPLWI